jgi:hypothetical protein|tara:strand:- start:273 stop:458 length:186 start_codon:yes stop_codon:yes gene_type:complete
MRHIKKRCPKCNSDFRTDYKSDTPPVKCCVNKDCDLTFHEGEWGVKFVPFVPEWERTNKEK